MAEEIGLEDLRVVANKVASPGDEQFLRAGLPDREILACIPFSEAIRRAERAGVSILDGVCDEVSAPLEAILRALEGERAS
jgi:CO dehydrogenase nickel-insertion accessory protein CooC1